MKKNPMVFLSVCALVCVLMGGCMSGSYEYVTANYVVVKTSGSDTLESLAEKYLGDRGKAWIISDFNKINLTYPGRMVIIPLHPFNLSGGMGQGGFQLVPVLRYDSFSIPGSPLDVTTQWTFPEQMAYLKRNGYHVISLSSLMDFFDEKAQITDKSLVITLDDNSKDVMTVAFPVLESLGYPATLFVDPGRLGKPGCLTEDDVVTLSLKGLDVQCRSGLDVDGDIDAGKISLEQYFQMLTQDIPRAKTALEKLTGKPCTVYAFPQTGGNNLMIGILKKTGFKAAVRTNGGANHFYGDPYSMGRITAPPVCPASDFADKLTVFRKLDIN